MEENQKEESVPLSQMKVKGTPLEESLNRIVNEKHVKVAAFSSSI